MSPIGRSLSVKEMRMFFLPVDVSDPHAQSRKQPFANWAIIGINILLFLLGHTVNWGVFRGAAPLQILGYGFAHASFWHLIMNMWILWLFGNPVNRRLGNGYYILVYLGTLLALGLFGFVFLSARIVGSSGAIFAVIGMAALLLPTARLTVVYLLIFPLSLLIGLISRPKYGIYWFLRGGEFKVSAGWCLSWSLPACAGGFWRQGPGIRDTLPTCWDFCVELESYSCCPRRSQRVVARLPGDFDLRFRLPYFSAGILTPYLEKQAWDCLNESAISFPPTSTI